MKSYTAGRKIEDVKLLPLLFGNHEISIIIERIVGITHKVWEILSRDGSAFPPTDLGVLAFFLVGEDPGHEYL